MHRHLIPPETIEEGTDIQSAPWRTEYDVISTLRGMGHEVYPLGVHDDLGDIRRAATEWKPHIAFNLLEGFDDISIFDQNVVSHLELLKLPYTGCNPRGLLLARDKSLSKKLLAYHRIGVPDFEVFRAGRPDSHGPSGWRFRSWSSRSRRKPPSASPRPPSSTATRSSTSASRSSTRASVPRPSWSSTSRDASSTWAFIGNQSLQALPVWELFFTNMPPDARRIATDRVKWSVKYQKKYGIESGPAKDLPEGVNEHVQHVCKRAYRALELSGFARIDLRMDEAGTVWVLEANPNPQIAKGEDFAASAEKIGMSYEAVLQRLINLGLRWQPESVA